MKNLKELVTPFYTQCLTVNGTNDPVKIMGDLLAENFLSVNTKEEKSKSALIGQVQFFWKLIPDLKWEPQEMLQDGNKVIVRSIATGTPKGDFMGLNTDGTKTFKIMSIDIHTIENDKIIKVHHIEEWTTALMQLK